MDIYYLLLEGDKFYIHSISNIFVVENIDKYFHINKQMQMKIFL